MKTIACLALIACGFLTMRAAPADETVKTVVISANDSLRFSVTRIDARPGEKIHVQLRNDGTMPKAVMGHNWVLLKGGIDPNSYAAAAVSAKAEDYEPAARAGDVLAAIPLLGPKETGEVTFAAPTTPGTYHYICSCPAHGAAGMRGTLVVK
jgi:azurin